MTDNLTHLKTVLKGNKQAYMESIPMIVYQQEKKMFNWHACQKSNPRALNPKHALNMTPIYSGVTMSKFKVIVINCFQWNNKQGDNNNKLINNKLFSVE